MLLAEGYQNIFIFSQSGYSLKFRLLFRIFDKFCEKKAELECKQLKLSIYAGPQVHCSLEQKHQCFFFISFSKGQMAEGHKQLRIVPGFTSHPRLALHTSVIVPAARPPCNTLSSSTRDVGRYGMQSCPLFDHNSSACKRLSFGRYIIIKS